LIAIARLHPHGRRLPRNNSHCIRLHLRKVNGKFAGSRGTDARAARSGGRARKIPRAKQTENSKLSPAGMNVFSPMFQDRPPKNGATAGVGAQLPYPAKTKNGS
jgi:hypothetical protein